LRAFNEEVTVRAVAASVIPIVSAVGHETDVTITDFAADVRALTPTAAAQMVVYDRREAQAGIQECLHDLHEFMAEKIKKHYAQAQASLQRLSRLTVTRLAHEQQFLSHREALLEKISPYAAFKRGFAFIKNEEGKPVTQAKGVKKGDALTLHWADGTVPVTVTGTKGKINK
jgi:exodeoxyribonuclease VII large subunit